MQPAKMFLVSYKPWSLIIRLVSSHTQRYTTLAHTHTYGETGVAYIRMWMYSTKNFTYLLSFTKATAKLIKNDKFLIQSASQTRTLTVGLFMTSLNFSLNQDSLSKWILLQFYWITSVIYELLQRAHCLFKLFVAYMMHHFLRKFANWCYLTRTPCKFQCTF